MEDNRPEKDLNREQQNTDTGQGTSRKTRHTWIGDKDEIRPDLAERPVSRMTMQENRFPTTRLVERERKPYSGFITDEEIKHAEAAAELDRKSIEERRAARAEMTQTKVYSGFGSGMEEPETKAEETPPARKPKRRMLNIRVADSQKFKRLIALAAVFVCLLIFEISFFVMKAQTASLPGKTEKIKASTEALTEENTKLQADADAIGDLDQIRENRDSWQRIKDKLTESE